MVGKQRHLVVKWNPQHKFHKDAPDTITIHCEILRRYLYKPLEQYVWWGKINKSGKLGIDNNIVHEINDQITHTNLETHLYLYCPDSLKPSLHVGNLVEVSAEEKNKDEHTPCYYQEVNYPVAYWFKIRDIRKISLKAIDNLYDDQGNDYDPVASNFYPMLVFERNQMEFFQLNYYYFRELEGRIMRCFKTGSTCAKENDIEIDSKLIFIGMPFKDKHKNVYEFVIKPTLAEIGLSPWIASEVFSNIDIMCKVCEGIQRSTKAVIDISGWNANVLFELGIVFGLSKEAILLKEENEPIPVDLKGMEYIPYSFDRFGDLKNKLKNYLC
jgi:hypothetical protein